MIPRSEIESWVKEALASSDPQYQLVEVVRTAIEVTASNCAQVAERWNGFEGSSAGRRIAEAIREAIGYKLIVIPAKREHVPSSIYCYCAASAPDLCSYCAGKSPESE